MASKQVVLITGANTGLGLEIVRALCKSETAYDILVGSRKLESATSAIETVKKEVPGTQSTLSELQIDIHSDDSIQAALEQVSKQKDHIDVLINNAGAGFDGEAQAGRMTVREAFNKAWDVNVTGTHIMTLEFMPLLLKSSNPRLIFMTSGTSPLAETERFDHPIFQRLNASPEAGWPKKQGVNPVWSYRASKTGLNMLMRQWVQTLRNDNVKIWCVSPGFLATGLGGVGEEQLKKVGLSLSRFSLLRARMLTASRWVQRIPQRAESSSRMWLRARGMPTRAKPFASIRSRFGRPSMADLPVMASPADSRTLPCLPETSATCAETQCNAPSCVPHLHDGRQCLWWHVIRGLVCILPISVFNIVPHTLPSFMRTSR